MWLKRQHFRPWPKESSAREDAWRSIKAWIDKEFADSNPHPNGKKQSMHEWKSDCCVETMDISGYPPGAEPGMMKSQAGPGRPRRRGPTKLPVTIRLDADVLAALKESGPGWQTRANDVIRRWIMGEDKRTEDQ